MSALAAIHVARKQLGLDEDTYRAVLVRVTGKDSAGAMSEAERERVVQELRRQGFKPSGRAAGRFAGKLQALWIGCWNLGLINDRSDAGLTSFVKRQTKVDHTRFLRHAEDADKVIEALKGWMTRDAGVDWRRDRFLPAWTQANGYRIASAQFAMLKAHDAEFAAFRELQSWLDQSRPGANVTTLDDAGWISVMNELGVLLRKSRP